MLKTPLTIIVLAHNEEDNLPDCLKSASFADEIIVVDSNSSDRTVDIAKSFGAKVLQRDLNNDYGAQRNFAISNATYEWIFMLDSDERITDELAHEIKICVESNRDCTYQVSRENHFIERKVLHGVMRPDRVERLFKKEGSLDRKSVV